MDRVVRILLGSILIAQPSDSHVRMGLNASCSDSCVKYDIHICVVSHVGKGILLSVRNCSVSSILFIILSRASRLPPNHLGLRVSILAPVWATVGVCKEFGRGQVLR